MIWCFYGKKDLISNLLDISSIVLKSMKRNFEKFHFLSLNKNYHIVYIVFFFLHQGALNFMKDSTLIQTELWFLPMTIVMITTTILSIVLRLIFISIAMMYKTSWSVQMILTYNSCLAEVFLSIVLLSLVTFAFWHHIKQNTGNISIYINLGLFCYVIVNSQIYSYL
jgi:hypothetical protein